MGRRLPDPTGDSIIPHNNTAVGADGFVKKTETPDATSVADILERNARELGFIRITFTEQGQVAGVEWSSAQPVMTLSHFLRAMEGESTSAEASGESSGDS